MPELATDEGNRQSPLHSRPVVADYNGQHADDGYCRQAAEGDVYRGGESVSRRHPEPGERREPRKRIWSNINGFIWTYQPKGCEDQITDDERWEIALNHIRQRKGI